MRYRQPPRCLLMYGVVLFVTFAAAGVLAAQSDEGLDRRPVGEDDVVSSPTATAYTHVAPLARAARSDQVISVDGRLDEASWRAAPVISDFIQIDPFEGQPASERTEVRIVYDDGAVYVGATLSDSAPVSTRLARRDANVPSSDAFEITFDSYHDHQTAYRFGVNPSGVKQDNIVAGGGGGGDQSWDPVWEVATAITDEGWVVEMRIPFSQLRFGRQEQQVWGLQIERLIHRNQETAVFAYTPRLQQGGVPAYGHLEGISDIRTARRLELLPYVGGRAEYREILGSEGVDFANPFRSGSDYFGDFGLDLQYGITSNLTLNATANPDFGQVEVDPAVINLTAFETRFEERRPFFVEGAEIFQFGQGGPGGSTGRGPQLLYSRRIGRTPQRGVPGDAVFSDIPTATTILGAAKLTGKTQGGWSVGLLQAVTGRETGLYVDAEGSRGEVTVEPLTNYSVARVRRDFRNGGSSLGAIFTTVNRRLDDPTLEDNLRRTALSAGIDFGHEWGNRTWQILGAFTPSYVAATPDVMIQTQRSSSRYYHRPDASHLRVDSAATSLAGYYAMLDFAKIAGSFQAKAAVGFASPGYEVNDIGFQTAADRIMFDTHWSYRQLQPGRILRRWDIQGSFVDAVWNYGRDRIFSEFNVFSNYTFLNYWSAGWRLAFSPETLNDRLTRGGPLSRDPRGYSGSFSINSDSRKNSTGRLQFQWAVDDGGSWSRGVDLNLASRIGANWDIRVGPSVDRSYTAAQFITAVTDEMASETYGRRYVFAGLDQTTLGIDTRANVTFTPTLSFELYVQPFISVGRYAALKELRTAGVFDFLEYGQHIGTNQRGSDGRYHIDPDGDPATDNGFSVADPDFNFSSLRGNAVLRWEWRPGSTIYLVWQQNRSERLLGSDAPAGDRVGRFDLSRDIRALRDIRPENVLALKINYWLNP